MLPGIWVGRQLTIRYVGADGKAASTSGRLADWCPAGVILRGGADSRLIFLWDRIVLIELAGS